MHISVLLNEAIAGLNLKEDGIYVDCTLGDAGHSSEILKRITRGCLFAFDQDEEAIKYSDNELKKIGNNYKLFHTNFVNLKSSLNDEGIREVDGIIYADLAFNGSGQWTNANGAYSYSKKDKDSLNDYYICQEEEYQPALY